MPKGEIPVGPASRRAARAVAELRDRLGLGKTELGGRVGRIAGRAVSIDVITKIEKGERRLDPDDLIALALALGVTPNRLMLPASAVGDTELAATVTVPAHWAWTWACGDEPLPVDEPGELATERRGRFRRENRPHEPESRQSSYIDVVSRENAGEFDPIRECFETLINKGVPPQDISTYIAGLATKEIVSAVAKPARKKKR
jgi:transcriptional regulator with XRE-family HTH domain